MKKNPPALSGKLLPVLLLLCSVQPVTAARLYNIEVIVFSQSGQGQGLYSVDYDTAAGGKRFTGLSAAHFRLKPVEYSLRQGGHDILFHRAWRQAAHTAARAPAYPVQSHTGGRRLEGTIRLERGRYLHLDVDLRLEKTAPGGAPGMYAEETRVTPVYRLTEKRRLKRGELHYFDHPAFGLLAIVTPYRVLQADTPDTQPESSEQGKEPAAENSTAPERNQLTE